MIIKIAGPYSRPRSFLFGLFFILNSDEHKRGPSWGERGSIDVYLGREGGEVGQSELLDNEALVNKLIAQVQAKQMPKHTTRRNQDH